MAAQNAVTQATKSTRPINENIQPKQPNRPLNILPSNATIRPASSVSTQTIGAQTPVSTLERDVSVCFNYVITKLITIR